MRINKPGIPMVIFKLPINATIHKDVAFGCVHYYLYILIMKILKYLGPRKFSLLRTFSCRIKLLKVPWPS